MANGDIIICNEEGIVCMDCGKDIKIGQKMSKSSTTRKEKKYVYIYCVPCKKKDKHKMNKVDYERIYLDLKKNPMFKDEFMSKYGYSASNTNVIMRKLINYGYDVRIFRWRYRNKFKMKVESRTNISHTANNFIIYFACGTEDKVLLKILDAFDFELIHWRDLMTALFGRRIPQELRNKEAITQWAKQNVFN